MESKCVSKEWEIAIGGPLGKVCPRVEISTELEPEAELLEFALFDRLRCYADARARGVQASYGLTDAEMNLCLSRVSATLAHPDLSSVLNPPEVSNG